MKQSSLVLTLFICLSVFSVAAAVGGGATDANGQMRDISMDTYSPRRMRGGSHLADAASPHWQGQALHFAAEGGESSRQKIHQVAEPIGYTSSGKAVMAVTPFAPPLAVDPKRCPTGHFRIGCTADDQILHRRWYDEHVPKEDQQAMTIDVCYNFCRNVSGASFFGLRNGFKCYCMPFFEQGPGAYGGDCDKPCEGNPGEICGGITRAEIYEMHDCNNMPAVPCKRPPPHVENAKVFESRYYRKAPTVCKNAMNGALSTHEQLCNVECEDGYYLSSNTLKCTEKGDRLTYAWAQFEGKAICAPVKCGSPHALSHARKSNAPLVYHQKVAYTCQLGYSLDAAALGNKTQRSMCQADMNFEPVDPCKAVNCGPCPRGPLGKLGYADNQEPEGLDRVFEDTCTYDCQVGYTLDQQATGVAQFSTKCMATGNFSEAQECLPVSCGAPPHYKNTIAKAVTAKSCPAWCGTHTQTVEHVCKWMKQCHPCSMCEAEHFDNSKGLEETAVYKDLVEVECVTGYSLTSLASGEKTFDVQCQANGMFTKPKSCKPVKCGAPAPVKNAVYDTKSLVYLETVTYTCQTGYTHTGVAGELAHQTIACGSDGQYEEAANPCIPVVCGALPKYENGKCITEKLPSELNFDSPEVSCSCNPGYSTSLSDNPFKPTATAFGTACEANGEFAVPPACVNIDDCLVHTCGQYGDCEDKTDPSGVALDDYSCKCIAGYEETLKELTGKEGVMEKICTNINDCPVENTCGGINALDRTRGTCQDIVLGYNCMCGSGYSVSYISDLPENQTCTPVVCGEIPGCGNGTADGATVGEKADYDTPPWKYVCDEGYTLEGVATGTKSFDFKCQSAGTFSGMSECQPVTCGNPKPVAHSDVSPQYIELFFPQQMTFTCDDGYSLDQKATGEVAFEVKCQSNGEQTAYSECLPVECGKIPEHAHATYDTARVFVFPETTDVECVEGYSLDQTPAPDSMVYTLNCQANGTFTASQECKPVLCGVATDVPNTTHDMDEKVYQDIAKYTCQKGFSLDGTVSGGTEFETECLASAMLSDTKPALPISCGPAPTKEFAGHVGAESYVYSELAPYSCNQGYSVDGKASGEKTFTVKCEADGKFVGIDGCQPVSCGDVTPLANAAQVEDSKNQKHKSLVFGQTAQYKCKPGYARDGKLNSQDLYPQVACAANGTLDYPTRNCVNIDDCVGPMNKCPTRGACKDLPNPTGVHIDDFQCECQSGFAENVSATEGRYCYNVPDCPQGACIPGSCHDLINDYNCSCPSGYFPAMEERKSGMIMELQQPGVIVTYDDAFHHCVSVSCGPMQPVEHAAYTAPSHEIFFDSAPVGYTCDEGYTLDGSAAGEQSFERTCLANKSFSPAPICHPVACGTTPSVENCDYTAGELVYTETVDYTCHEGFSTDATWTPSTTSPNNKKFSSDCLADGLYSFTKSCLRIKCPAISAQAFTTLSVEGRVMKYESSVSQQCIAGYALEADKHSLVSYTISCDAKGALINTAQDGSELGARICTPIDCGALPIITHATVAGGQLYGESATVTCAEGYSTDHSTVPESAVQTTQCQTTGSYSQVSDCLPVSCGIPPVVRNASRSVESEQFYEGGQVDYSLHTGHTLDGTAEGAKQFGITCQTDGTFTPVGAPKPVECGPAPSKSHSTYPGRSRVYPQIEPYTCLKGYSVDAQAAGAKVFDLECAASSEYTGPDGCKAVECGAPPTPDHTKRMGDDSALVFPEQAGYQCLPGYSMDGRMEGETSFMTRCQANGTHSPHAGCKNKNDCEGHMCGPNGKCVDHENPTGVHKDDYNCDCNSGYEEEIEDDGTRTCGNIPDCPEGACLPGTCEDLVNDYKCHCTEGYTEDENDVEKLPHDCMPNPCGEAPTAPHAKTTTTGVVKFDHAPVVYTCDEGYSMDASAGGQDQFSIACKADKSFEPLIACLPVECGVAPVVEYSKDVGDSVRVFKDTVNYECNAGYSVDGTAKGAKTFTATCESTGALTGVQSCEPVACPADGVKFGVDCTYDTASSISMVFPAILNIECTSGHATNKDDPKMTAYTATCEADGTIKIPADQCVPVDCGAKPNVDHATVEGGTLYKESLTVTPDKGWMADGIETPVTMRCQATGEFSKLPSMTPVVCGVAPAIDFSTRDTDAKVFKDKAKYTCEEGYSLDGTTSGKTTFLGTCLAAKIFGGLKHCLPVSCGGFPAKAYAMSFSYSGTELVYKELVGYTCDAGYSTDGIDITKRSWSEKCEADGKFSPVEGLGTVTCKPVKCGTVKPPQYATQLATDDGKKNTSLVFGETAKFKCEPGYSKDGVLNSELMEFHVSCQAIGELYYPAECINNNDCASPENQCTMYGSCVDKSVATGNHMQDFSCECSSGYQEEVVALLSEGMDGLGGQARTCSNIPDCPEGACVPGQCNDLVNDYHCSCPEGYFVSPDTHSCEPVSCGNAPQPEYTEKIDTKEVTFDSPPVRYTCLLGYTLDGTATGEGTFSGYCEADGNFTITQQCQPVSCGPLVKFPFTVANFDNDVPGCTQPDEFAFDTATPTLNAAGGTEKIVYSNIGSVGEQSVDLIVSTAPGLSWTENNDGASGVKGAGLALINAKSGLKSSLMFSFVKSGTTEPFTVPSIAVSLYDIDSSKKGPEKYEIKNFVHYSRPSAWATYQKFDTVAPGHVIVESISVGTSSDRPTNADSELTAEQVGRSLTFYFNGVTSFPFDIDLTGITGKGAGGRNVYFSLKQVVGRNDCPVPADTHTTFDQTFGQQCQEGYSLDATAQGQSTFSVTCGSEGMFQGIEDCSPVKCPSDGDLGPNSHFDHGALAVFAFPGLIPVTCLPGYALNASDISNTNYTAVCESNGQITLPKEKCQPIDCGPSPVVEHASVTGSTLYGGTLVAKAETGYTVDGTVEGATSFEFRCMATGKFSVQRTFSRIECGQVPHVSHVSSVKLHPMLESLESSLMQVSAAWPRKRHALALLAKNNHTIAKARRESNPMALYGDVLEFDCAEGYRASIDSEDHWESASWPSSFKMECQQSGDLAAIEPENLLSAACVPVVCPVEPPSADSLYVVLSAMEPIGEPLGSLPMGLVQMEPLGATSHPSTWTTKEYMQVQPMMCVAGFTVDGSTFGDAHFAETCEANGAMSNSTTCKDIDWCAVSKCGENGKCVDGKMTYTCDCNAGYEAMLHEDGSSETCVQIDECITNAGNDLCGGMKGDHGKCLDGTLEYTCECNSGYENSPFGSLEEAMGESLVPQDSCSPVTCSAVPARDHATTPMLERKIVYLQTATYTCNAGYSLDSSAHGLTTFTIECQADKQYPAFSDCLPVDCGEPAAIEHATRDSKGPMTFEMTSQFTCDDGYSPTGSVRASKTFGISCTAIGVLTQAQSCLPVSCDVPPTVHNADGHYDEVFFGGVVTYTCKDGFRTNGEASGPASFDATCGAEGDFTGVENCLPVSCGTPALIRHSQMPLSPVFYPQQFEVICDAGYTVDGTVTGSSTFIMQCGADGKVSGTEECRAVSCGKPMPTDGSDAQTVEMDVVYLEASTWTCKTGYSLDGTKDGLKKFERICEANGAFQEVDPEDCADIDYCIGNPCTANGQCTDAGAGVPAPGYTCVCYEGYETKTRADGGQYCTEDDCAGAPCGVGGTCTDLSKQGGEPGTYACECEPGYEMIESKDAPGKPTCQRTSCGPLPTAIDNTELSVQKVPAAEVRRWLSESPLGEPMSEPMSGEMMSGEMMMGFHVSKSRKGEPMSGEMMSGEMMEPMGGSIGGETMDAFTGTEIMMSFDNAEFTCAAGFSTDGSMAPAARTFDITCTSNGLFSRDISKTSECQPVRCDNYALPNVPNTFILEREEFYEYGDIVKFQCEDGYTVGGHLGGVNQFSVPCQMDATFPIVTAQCMPIPCAVPVPNYATASASPLFPITYSAVVAFSCYDGYETSSGETSFSGKCTESGQLDYGELTFHGIVGCEPVACGGVPEFANAVVYKPGGETMGGEMMGGEPMGGEMMGGEMMSGEMMMGMVQKKTMLGAHRRVAQSKNNKKKKKGVPSGYSRVMSTDEITYADPALRVQCDEGNTVNGVSGGVEYFTLECQSHGSFTTPTEKCQSPRAHVQGEITDAQSIYVKLSGADLKFYVDKVDVANATSNSYGVYGTYLPFGIVQVVVTVDGYITYEGDIEVLGDISVGQGGDVGCSKVLPPGDWRVLLTWGELSTDLDSHTYFGSYAYTHVGWWEMGPTTDAESGVTVTLDRDDVTSYGPETTTFSGIGDCPVGGDCMVYFKVMNYAYASGDMGASKAVVTLYNGDQVYSTWNVPTSTGADKWYTVFSMDATVNAVSVYDGYVTSPPKIQQWNKGSKDWRTSFNTEMWNKVPSDALIYGISASGSMTALNHIDYAQYYNIADAGTMTCKETDFTALNNKGTWATCPEGYYVNGFYRVGNAYDDVNGVDQLTQANCCRPSALIEKWGICTEVAAFSEDCGGSGVIVALYRSAEVKDTKLAELDKLKCCQFPGGQSST